MVNKPSTDPAQFGQQVLHIMRKDLQWFTWPHKPKQPLSIEDWQSHIRELLLMQPGSDKVRGELVNEKSVVVKDAVYQLLYGAMQNEMPKHKMKYQEGGEIFIPKTIDDRKNEFRLRYAASIRDKCIYFDQNDHPLQGDYRLRTVKFSGDDKEWKSMRLSVPQVKVAEWFSGGSLAGVLEQDPRLLQVSPEARVNLYAVRLRKNLFGMLKDKVELNSSDREDLSSALISEWLNLLEPFMGEIIAIGKQLGIEDAPQVGDARILMNAVDIGRITPEKEKEMRLFINYTAMLAFTDTDLRKEAVNFINTWTRFSEGKDFIPCENPLVIVGILAAFIKNEDLSTERIRNQL